MTAARARGSLIGSAPTRRSNEPWARGCSPAGASSPPSFGVNYQFANRSLRMWAIDAGYYVAQFLLFGLVLGLWH